MYGLLMGHLHNRQLVEESDCILNPVAEYHTIDRIRADATRTQPGLGGTYVMCEVLSADHEPHKSNTRTHCQKLNQ